MSESAIRARQLIESWDLQHAYDDIDWKDKLAEIVPQLAAIMDGDAKPDGLSEYLEHARTTMFPMMKGSAMSISILPSEEPDPKICLELGAAILFEKPLVILSVKGAIVPDALRRIADAVVEIDDIADPNNQKNCRQQLRKPCYVTSHREVNDGYSSKSRSS